MTSEQTTAGPARDQFATPILISLAGGCAVAVLLGVYAKVHHPTGFALDIAGFSSPLYAKAWLATAALVFAAVQLATAYRMRRAAAAAWLATVHRWSGRIAILLTVPVIIHRIYALGFQTYSLRVLAHSVLGCLFYGAFVAKMLSLGLIDRRAMPRWLMPALGGAVLLSLIGVWATSALWLFTTKGLHS
jgi:hypothetical protein